MNKGNILINIIIVLVIILILGFLFYCITIDYWNKENIEIIVKDKYIKRSIDENADIYYVATEEGEVYKITDLLFKGKFNSSDLYNELDIGKKYKVEVTGVRIPIFSMYKNLNKVEPVEN